MITIIPAIDIIDGHCVRLTGGDFSRKKVYSSDPLSIARQFEDASVKRLHLVDLDGAKAGKIKNAAVLKNIAAKTNLQIDFGGGIQSDADLELAFQSGASQITAGSIAVKNRALTLRWIGRFGAEKIILGADVKNGNIAVSGWQETSALNLIEFVESYVDAGMRYIISTNVARDGRMLGPDFDLYTNLKRRFPQLFVIASGGVRSVSDIKKLNDAGIDGVIIGKALYENTITLNDLKEFLC